MAIPEPFIDLIQPYTKTSRARIASMYDALVAVDHDDVVGDVVEVGVWRGGNIMMARMLSPHRVCWLYDTFDGMTEPDPVLDVKPDGARALDRYRNYVKDGRRWNYAGKSEVMKYFEDMKLMDNTIWVEGEVERTLVEQPKPERISILRLDVDWYYPTKAALEHLYGRVSHGGFLIVDDYGHWMGAKKAVDEYFAMGKPPMRQIDYSCVVIRK